MKELQQQILTWCESLKNYLKCDQCDETLVKDIYLCEAGHLVCVTCRQESANDKCSICKMRYTKVRNFLAENLAEKMETIMKTIGANDDDDDLRSVCSDASNASWNTYYCWIGKCKFQGSTDEIRQHYQENHRGLFVKHSDNNLPHSTSFHFDYSFPKIMDRILDISDIGLFHLRIIVYDNGALRAYVCMYENKRNANKFQYKLKIQCNAQNKSVEGEVDTVRIPKSALSKKGMFVQRAHNLQIELTKSLKFTCHIELNKNRNSGEKHFEQSSSDPKKNPQMSFPPKNRDKSTNETHPNPQNQQEKPNNSNPKKPNPRKKPNSEVKGENGKKSVEKKLPEVQNYQSRVNNPLQTSGGQNSGVNGGIIPPLFSHPPPFSPRQNFGGQQMGYPPPNGGFNYQRPGLPQGLQHHPQHFGAFPGANPHYCPPPSPGISGAHYGQPSAPVEEGREAHGVHYPDLTKMKQKMTDNQFSVVQSRVMEKERARNSSSESKDKCVIS